MHVREGVFEVSDDLVFCLNRVRSTLVHARVTGRFFLEYAGAQKIVVRCDVFKLLGRLGVTSTNTLLFAKRHSISCLPVLGRVSWRTAGLKQLYGELGPFCIQSLDQVAALEVWLNQSFGKGKKFAFDASHSLANGNPSPFHIG